MTTQPKQTTRSEEVVRKHREYLWPAVTNFYQQPLVADHGSMQYVWDVEGRKYLDFFGGILTISVGHANPRITGPVKAQVDKLQHLSTLYPNEAIVVSRRKSGADHSRHAAVELFHQFRHRSERSCNPSGAHGHRLLTTWWRCATPMRAAHR